MTKNFYYSGTLGASKSLMNRALVVRSFFEELKIVGDSGCDDVMTMKKALEHSKAKNPDPIDCGHGGTCLRFLLARLSRRPGNYFLKAASSLLNRPHDGLLKALEQMGVCCEIKQNQGIIVISEGWKIPDFVEVDVGLSSQYATSILLSAWDLPKTLVIRLKNNKHSRFYLKMTLSFLNSLGLEIIENKEEWVIPGGQKIKKSLVQMEPDMSSAFALAALAAASGELKLKDFPEQSLQPDFLFTEILKEMGVFVDYDPDQKQLHVKKTNAICAIERDLSNQPDLFPVLAVLLSRAKGVSHLRGLDLLSYKESDRLVKTAELLEKMNFKLEKSKNSMTIHANPQHHYPPSFDFHPAGDHRMVMAATLALFQGASLNIHDTHQVNKSFPEFLEIAGLC